MSSVSLQFRRAASRALRHLGVVLAVAQTSQLAAQAGTQTPLDLSSEVFVGSEAEEYLRYLQSSGLAGAYPWSLRGFGPAEIDRISPADEAVHPWSERYRFRSDPAPGPRVTWIRPELGTVYNSAFPYGSNDGPVWAGRGLTTALRMGVAVRYGPLSITAAPMAVWSENREFDMPPNGYTGPLSFADGAWPTFIDLPRRFGPGSFARLDPGQSTARVDAGIVTVGVSTANQQWGPATWHPLVLGNNAPGFLHGFLGSSRPLSVGVGRVHGRFVWGSLHQSPYSSVPADSSESRRFMSGAVALFQPRGLDGLEVGASRFFHTSWPRRGIGPEHYLQPLEMVLKGYLSDRDTASSDGKSDRTNQIASVFFRWNFPASGLEAYGEYGREDHNWNIRDFLLEPDHASAYMLGVRKAWLRSDSRMIGLRAEVMNAEPSHLLRVRLQSPFHRHTLTVQGHTHRGQLLGSAAAYGGAASGVAMDLYDRGGRWTVRWSRAVQANGSKELGRTELPEYRQFDDPGMYDVVQSLGVEGVRFRGRWEVSGGIGADYNFNRNYQGDVLNLNARLQLRAAL